MHDHPIAPTKLLSVGPHADRDRYPYGQVLAAAYDTQVEGPDPGNYAQSQSDWAAHPGRLPPGILYGSVASGHLSTDPIDAGDRKAPGLLVL